MAPILLNCAKKAWSSPSRSARSASNKRTSRIKSSSDEFDLFIYNPNNYIASEIKKFNTEIILSIFPKGISENNYIKFKDSNFDIISYDNFVSLETIIAHQKILYNYNKLIQGTFDNNLLAFGNLDKILFFLF